MSKQFVQPKVAIGDTVHFYHGKSVKDNPDEKAILALVTDVHPQGVELAILPKDNFGFQLRESVTRHRDDPLTQRELDVDPDAGFWVERPDTLAADEVAAIRKLLAEFAASLTGRKPVAA